jgi:hypothetical protein
MPTLDPLDGPVDQLGPHRVLEQRELTRRSENEDAIDVRQQSIDEAIQR